MRGTWPFIGDGLDDCSGLGAEKICDIQSTVYTNTLYIYIYIYIRVYIYTIRLRLVYTSQRRSQDFGSGELQLNFI